MFVEHSDDKVAAVDPIQFGSFGNQLTIVFPIDRPMPNCL